MIHTTKFKLLVICMSVFLAVLVLTSALLYNDIRNSLTERELEAGEHSLATARANIDRDYTQVIQFVLWNSNTMDITNFLTAARSGAPNKEYRRVQAFNTALRQLNSLSISDILEKAIISSLEEDYITLGRGIGNVNDWIQAKPHVSRDADLEYKVIDTPFSYNIDPQVIAFSGKVYTTTGSDVVGWADVFLSTGIIARQFSTAQLGDGSRSFVIIAGELYEIQENRISAAIKGAERVLEVALTPRGNDVFLGSGRVADQEGDFLLTRSTVNGWTYIQTYPSPTLLDYSPATFTPILWITLIFVLFATFLVFVLYKIINKPIQRICRHIDRVATGNFTRDPMIETADEFGYIGKGINTMSERIEELIDTSLTIQREKKNYEFKVLQSQINPHFLYNTLNSIKWMATIQKATGIVEMSTTLARMLRRLVRIKDELVTLAEELQFIDDYVVIQQYRYGDMFQYRCEIGDPALHRAKVIKFTLQPLVENAIFHGLDPQKEGGTVRLVAVEKNGELYIEVADDGVGIPPDELARLNRFAEDPEKAGNSIGLSNIHRRIQLEYGPGYGLAIDSVAGSFTSVTVHTPLIMEGESRELSGAPEEDSDRPDDL